MSYINAEEERKATKFKNMLSRRPATSSSRFVSDYVTDRECSVEKLGDPLEYQKALSLRNSFENSAAKIIRLRLDKKDVRAPIEGSMNTATFQDGRVVKQEIIQFSPVDFHLAFNEKSTCGVVKIRDIVSIVRKVVGEEVPLWIVNKFVSLGREVAHYKEITWPQFRNVCLKVQEVVDYEFSQGGVNIPEWINGTPNGKGLVGYKHNSSYMNDFDEKRLLNYDDMKKNASKTGSTRDLFLGTTKNTFQLPSYSGHIPQNTNNAKKDLHSRGTDARPPQSYLRLVSERLGSVPSYSGYIPMSTGLNGDRKTGMDPLTTTGSTFRPHN